MNKKMKFLTLTAFAAFSICSFAAVEPTPIPIDGQVHIIPADDNAMITGGFALQVGTEKNKLGDIVTKPFVCSVTSNYSGKSLNFSASGLNNFWYSQLISNHQPGSFAMNKQLTSYSVNGFASLTLMNHSCDVSVDGELCNQVKKLQNCMPEIKLQCSYLAE